MRFSVPFIAAAAASELSCGTPGTAGCKFDDSNAQVLTNVDLAECCSKCDADPSCEGYSSEKKGFLRSAKCYLHKTRDMPETTDSKFICAMKPAPPTPPPAPTPNPPPFTASNWAVIIAGSTGYANYRHQADACHAKQVVLKNGIPESNSIVMMEDDVANNKENPFKGKLFNKPTKAGDAGNDVYAGCNPDYTGSDVTAETFLAVLSGDASKLKGKGNGKMLKSTNKDNVFVNFADHGGGQIVEMPHGNFLHASDLVDTLKGMHTKDMYGKLVFYMEACNGGSMFDGLLPTDINVFATTAANPNEPSWGTYCPPQDKVNGKSLGSCLGDLYSVNWMEDSDAQGESKTLEGQFETVVKLTTKSHPTAYGTQTWKSDEYVKDFQAHGSSDAATVSATQAGAEPEKVPVDQRDIELLQAFYAYLRSDENANGTKLPPTELAASGNKRSKLADALVDMVKKREEDDERFTGLLKSLSAHAAENEGLLGASVGSKANSDCIKTVTASVQNSCGDFNSYSLKFHNELVSYCSKMPADEISSLITYSCVPTSTVA